MKTRLISGAILILITVAITLASAIPFILNASVSVLSIMAVLEVLSVSKYQEKALKIPSACFAAAVPFLPKISELVSDKVGFLTTPNLIFAAIFIYVVTLFCILMFSQSKCSLEHMGFVILITLIISSFFSSAILLNMYENGILYIVLLLVCAWGADCGGYVFGCLFGRKKFVPVISPKKTWAGVIGCLATALSLALITGYAVSTISTTITVNYISLALCGIFGAIFSIIGDLSASFIKRCFGVKDFGSLIPGHGGIMDRFDSVLFASPVIYFIITAIPAFINK